MDEESESPSRGTRCFEQPFRFLDLFAELRNRIYGFALTAKFPKISEEVDIMTKPDSILHPYHHWEFLGLTQTCRQIRTEFRPLWLRNAVVGVPYFEDSKSFFSVFMPTDEELKHAPTLLLIAWDCSMQKERVSHDITHLLRVRALCSRFRFNFVPCRLGKGRPRVLDGKCAYCTKCEDEGFAETVLSQCTCPPWVGKIEGWDDVYIRRFDFLRPISQLLQANSEAWLADLRDDNISVGFVIPKRTKRLVICIHDKTQIYENVDNNSHVQALGTRWGLSDLGCPLEVCWMLTYKSLPRNNGGIFRIRTPVV